MSLKITLKCWSFLMGKLGMKAFALCNFNMVDLCFVWAKPALFKVEGAM